MAKIFLWIAAVMLAIFVVRTQYLTSKTYQPFVDGCLAGGKASEAQCECLADYLHKRYSDNEMQAIMDNQLGEALSQAQVEEDIRLGSRRCADAR